MSATKDHSTLIVGDSDLFLLGFSAILAARFEHRRKSGRTGSPEDFSQPEREALRRLVQGVTSGSYLPLDDLREIEISIHAGQEDMEWLLGVARPSDEPEEDDDG